LPALVLTESCDDSRHNNSVRLDAIAGTLFRSPRLVTICSRTPNRVSHTGPAPSPWARADRRRRSVSRI